MNFVVTYLCAKARSRSSASIQIFPSYSGAFYELHSVLVREHSFVLLMSESRLFCGQPSFLIDFQSAKLKDRLTLLLD